MIDYTSFTIKTACVALYLLLANSILSSSEHCHNPMMSFVMAEVQMSDGKVNYCLGVWICNHYKTLSYIKAEAYNSSCKHVLTAASCVKSEDSNNIRVFYKKDKDISKHDGLDELFVIEVISQTYYPTYDSTTHIGDIVLLKLATRHSDKYVIELIINLNLQNIVNIIRNSRNSETTGNVLIVTWDINEHFKTKSNDLMAYYEEDLVDCPAKGDSSSSIEGKFWFMFICIKENKYTPNISIGAKLIYCVSKGNISSTYSLGLYADSFELNGEKVSRYSLLHWYKPWIYSIMDLDNIHDLYDDTTDTADNITEIAPDIHPVYGTEYYGDTAYDNLIMGPNPWGNVAGIDGCFIWSDISLYVIIFNYLYIRFLIIT